MFSLQDSVEAQHFKTTPEKKGQNPIPATAKDVERNTQCVVCVCMSAWRRLSTSNYPSLRMTTGPQSVLAEARSDVRIKSTRRRLSQIQTYVFAADLSVMKHVFEKQNSFKHLKAPVAFRRCMKNSCPHPHLELRFYRPLLHKFSPTFSCAHSPRAPILSRQKADIAETPR